MKNKVILTFCVLLIVVGVVGGIFLLSVLLTTETEKIIVEENEYFQITQSEFQYYYLIRDKKHRIVKKEGPFTEKPNITLRENKLIQIRLQTGTGIGAQWAYFYEIRTNKFSQIFQCVYDENNGKVAYGDVDKIIVADIFDNEQYYKEFSSFEKSFSEVAVPIVDAKFIADGNSLKITYLSGDSYEVITEIKEL